MQGFSKMLKKGLLRSKIRSGQLKNTFVSYSQQRIFKYRLGVWDELNLKYPIWWKYWVLELVIGLLPVTASCLHVTQALFNHVSEQQIAFLCPKVFAVLSFGSWQVQFSGFCPWQKIKSGDRLLLWAMEVTGNCGWFGVQHQLEAT